MKASGAFLSLLIGLVAMCSFVTLLSYSASATIGPRQGSLTTTSTAFTGTFTLTSTSVITVFSYTGTVTTGLTSVRTAASTVTQLLESTQTSTSTSTVATLPGNPACAVASVTAGSFLESYANSLRGFRDNQVLRTKAGRTFMLVFNAWYYSWSPVVAHIADANHIFSAGLRVILAPLLGILFLSSYAYFVAARLDPEVGAIIAGFVAALLIGAVYMPPVAYAVAQALRLRGRTATILLKPLALCAASSGMLVAAATIIHPFLIVAAATLTLTLSSFMIGSMLGARAMSYALHSMVDRTIELRSNLDGIYDFPSHFTHACAGSGYGHARPLPQRPTRWKTKYS